MSDDTTRFIYVPDWSERACNRLLVKWRKPRMQALAQALGYGAQVLEDMQFDVLVSTTLDSATGDALDKWGEVVGEDRGPLTDSEYRQFIKARMLVNKSGKVDDASPPPIDQLIEILDVATQPNEGVRFLSNFPAGFYLQVTRSTFLSDEARRRVSRLMEDARPAGRHMTVIEALVNGFGFAGDPDAEGFSIGPFSRLLEVA